jgi:hypothetical protein
MEKGKNGKWALKRDEVAGDGVGWWFAVAGRVIVVVGRVICDGWESDL